MKTRAFSVCSRMIAVAVSPNIKITVHAVVVVVQVNIVVCAAQRIDQVLIAISWLNAATYLKLTEGELLVRPLELEMLKLSNQMMLV